MRTIKFMLTACGLSTLFLSAVIANAILAPIPEKGPSNGGWTTTVYKNAF